MRLRSHLGRQRFGNLETVAIVKMSAFGKPARIIGIRPLQNTHGAAGPLAPLHFVILRIVQQIGVPVARLKLVVALDVHRMERHADLLGKILRCEP